MTFDESDAVTTGTVMAQLDATPYREKLAAAEAGLQGTEAELDKLRTGNRPQEIAQSRERVNQAQVAASEAERNFKRQDTLLESGASSQRTVDAERATRDQTAADLASAKAALSLATAGFRSEDIAAGKARVAAAQATLAQASTAVTDTKLLAPSDGIVITRVREPDLGRIAPGTKVRVHTDSSDKVYHGQIGFISPRAEFTPKTVETTDLRTDLVYRLRVVVAAADQGLRQGMPVTVDVDMTRPATSTPEGR